MAPPAAPPRHCPRCGTRMVLERYLEGDEWACALGGCGFVDYGETALRASMASAARLAEKGKRGGRHDGPVAREAG